MAPIAYSGSGFTIGVRCRSGQPDHIAGHMRSGSPIGPRCSSGQPERLFPVPTQLPDANGPLTAKNTYPKKARSSRPAKHHHIQAPMDPAGR